jgi:hypothetical protein
VRSWLKSKKFPVFSLMIREFDAESISHQTASSAKQSATFAFSEENWRIVRVLARFLRPEGHRRSLDSAVSI